MGLLRTSHMSTLGLPPVAPSRMKSLAVTCTSWPFSSLTCTRLRWNELLRISDALHSPASATPIVVVSLAPRKMLRVMCQYGWSVRDDAIAVVA